MNRHIHNKHTQRKEIRRRINNLTPEYCISSDESISRAILMLPEYQNASCIFCYVSVGREIDTRSIIEDAWALGKRIAVPRCTSKAIMELFEIHSWQDLEIGSYQIPEPKAYCIPVSPSEIDFAIVPCLSCDKKRNRLGHGGGYYDRYLFNTSFPSAAVCREKLLLDNVCCEAHDRPVDFVITENAIY